MLEGLLSGEKGGTPTTNLVYRLRSVRAHTFTQMSVQMSAGVRGAHSDEHERLV